MPLPYVSSVFFLALTMLGLLRVNSCRHKHNITNMQGTHGHYKMQDSACNTLCDVTTEVNLTLPYAHTCCQHDRSMDVAIASSIHNNIHEGRGSVNRMTCRINIDKLVWSFTLVPNSTLSAHSTPNMREWSWLPTSYL